MRPSTIRGIHGILSGAFAAAQRWEWTDRNPAESAKPPTATRQPIPATSPEDVAKVIAEARSRSAALGLYLWLVVVTGARRGELCGLQGFDLRNTAARLGHSGGGATTLRHHADPVSEVDRRAAAYLAKLTRGSEVTRNGISPHSLLRP